ncbi:uncharacterized protein ASCRUDRAFT_75649 [Ascoidea rubescens DSM 1968]|uniref:Uncharacterized protein n=1 Tax=Ascoidea rubescens DSM 1968 TaxID=1344418 RepID=A0A1D2VJB7_9ASCO|nr:hypothetical protein ASCRUDRAFT_75649 [Ascoidea rubescens DSM 1968]ODV61670.1 hypothetical protein ASCRUDRAFT_75649 [Ascoidea rubescens DSM 1968]
MPAQSYTECLLCEKAFPLEGINKIGLCFTCSGIYFREHQSPLADRYKLTSKLKGKGKFK